VNEKTETSPIIFFNGTESVTASPVSVLTEEVKTSKEVPKSKLSSLQYILFYYSY